MQPCNKNASVAAHIASTTQKYSDWPPIFTNRRKVGQLTQPCQQKNKLMAWETVKIRKQKSRRVLHLTRRDTPFLYSINAHRQLQSEPNKVDQITIEASSAPRARPATGV